MKKTFMLFGLAVFCSGCFIRVNNNIRVDPAIAFEILKQDAYGGYEDRTNLVITSQGKLETLYKELNLSDVPVVDFSKNNVVAIFMGQKRTGGYSISVKSITVNGDTTFVKVQETKPDGMATMALTAPYSIVVIPKTENVKVEE